MIPPTNGRGAKRGQNPPFAPRPRARGDRDLGVVHQLSNHARIAFAASPATEYADDERLPAINLCGAIHGTDAFLPRLVPT